MEELISYYLFFGAILIFLYFYVKRRMDLSLIQKIRDYYKINIDHRLFYSDENIFGKGLSQEHFNKIVFDAEKRFARVNYLKTRGAVIYGESVSNTGKTNYGFRITFNHGGHVDGEYSYIIDINDDIYEGDYIKKVAEYISSEIIRFRNNLASNYFNDAYTGSSNVICKCCGAKNDSGYHFCKSCGAVILETIYGICPECGHSVKNSEYCIACGYEIRKGSFISYMEKIQAEFYSLSTENKKNYLSKIEFPIDNTSIFLLYGFLLDNLLNSTEYDFALVINKTLEKLSLQCLNSSLNKNELKNFNELQKLNEKIWRKKERYFYLKSNPMVAFKKAIIIWLIYTVIFGFVFSINSYITWKSNQVIINFDRDSMIGKNADNLLLDFLDQGFEDVDITYKNISYKRKDDDKKVYDIKIDKVKHFTKGSKIDKRSHVEIYAYEIKRVYSPKKNEGFTGKKLNTVRKKLKKAGFVNIKVKNNKKLKIGWIHKEDEVEKVIIDNKTDYDEYEYFYPDVKVTIVYYGYK